MDEKGQRGTIFSRHGFTRTVTIRLVFVVSLIMIVGIRFERTIIALAISALFLVVFVLLGRQES